MTIIVGRGDFAAARRAEAERDSRDRRLRRWQAAGALHDARSALSANAGAGPDCDRLEDIAARIVAFIDAIEPQFARLDEARDIASIAGPEGRRVERSRWDRPGLAIVLAEGFQEVLDGPALAVLVAATRLEVCA